VYVSLQAARLTTHSFVLPLPPIKHAPRPREAKHTQHQLITSISFYYCLRDQAAATGEGDLFYKVKYLAWDMETVVGDLMATELRLGLPGTVDDCSQHQQQTQLKVAAPPSNPTRGKKRPAAEEEEANKRDAEAAPPAAK
jgi:hypothetical protein